MARFSKTSTLFYFFFFFNDPPPTEIYTLSLHDALPILIAVGPAGKEQHPQWPLLHQNVGGWIADVLRDRKSTRLNSSHVAISYAVFCLKKKKKNTINTTERHIKDIDTYEVDRSTHIHQL